MKKYIKTNEAIGVSEEIEVIEDSTAIDISKDPDDTEYTFKSFEDYKYFADHVKL